MRMSKDATILVVDDDAEIREMLNDYLDDQGFEVLEAENGDAMRAVMADASPNLVLLDIHMPGEDGLTLARYLREHADVGIIMVTGASDTVDRIVGLEVGADDYVAKPFDLRELLARIRSVLRRCQATAPDSYATGRKGSSNAVRIGCCWLDLDARRLADEEGQEVSMTSMEFDLLKAFTSRPNRVLTRDDLMNLTQDRDWDPYDRSIDIHITRIRRKIESDPKHPQAIKTIRGAGYMFVPTKDN